MENKNIKDVYQITEYEGKKATWNKIGTAFKNTDGVLNVILNSLPVDGRLHIRDQRTKGES